MTVYELIQQLAEYPADADVGFIVGTRLADNQVVIKAEVYNE